MKQDFQNYTNEFIDKEYRCYNWFIVTYQPIEELQYIIDNCSKYAYIVHNCDFNEDGVRDKHIHLLVHFDRHTPFNRVKSLLNANNVSKQNNFCEQVRCKLSAWEYLTHKNHPLKYQYDENDIVTDNASFWCETKTDKNYIELIYDIINNVPLKDMVRKWGRDFIINYNKYLEFARLLKAENEKPIIQNEIALCNKHNLMPLGLEEQNILNNIL